MKFVICSQPRTGSHALASALDFHSELDVAGEVFFRPEEFGVYGDNPQEIVNSVKYDGCILHRSSAVKVKSTVDDIWQEIIKDKEIKIINLKRIDLLEMVISRLMAESSGIWQVKNRDSKVLAGYPVYRSFSPAPLHLDPQTVKFCLEKYKKEFEFFDKLFQNKNVKFLTVFYENLNDNWSRELNKIQNFLEVSIEDISPATLKQNSNRKYVSNYKELQDFFKNTEWSNFFPVVNEEKCQPCSFENFKNKKIQSKPIIDNNNKVINGLWIGEKLSTLEELTIRSFQENGHEFHLWTYDNFEIPVGTIKRDANEIIPKNEVFQYLPGTMIEKTVAGFSDIFRFALLYKVGGWYVDMDITCLKPFEFSEEIVLRRNNWIGTPVANVIKLPKGTSFAYDVWQNTKKLVDEKNIDFILPMSILAVEIAKHGLQQHLTSPELFINCLVNATIPKTDKFLFENDYDRKIAYMGVNNFRLSLIDNVAFAVHWNNQYHHWNKIDTSVVGDNTIYKMILQYYNLIK